MTRDTDDPMEAEFDTVAEWTAEVAADLGPEYFVPAACRGSGKPAALDWLLTGLRPGPGDQILDVGAGIGGPAAYGGPGLRRPRRGSAHGPLPARRSPRPGHRRPTQLPQLELVFGRHGAWRPFGRMGWLPYRLCYQ